MSKQEGHNAIDVMLRKLGRSATGVMQNSGNGAPESNGVHLDADELNAYAENALPTATRARYTDHLADCASCRQIVAQLSQAAGLILNETNQPEGAGGVKSFLARLLSPIALRYAVPAPGLLVVASLGFFVLRQSRPMHLAEMRQSQKTVGQPPVSSPAEQFGTNPGKLDDKTTPHTPTPQRAENERSKLADDSERQEREEQSAKQPVTVTDQGAAVSANAPAEPPPSSPKPAAVEDRKQLAAEVAQAKVQATPQPEQNEGAKSSNYDETRAKRPAKEQPAETVGSFAVGKSAALKKEKTVNSAGVASSADGPKGERDRIDKDQSETTAVGGHRFRRSGSLWIDVDYNASQPSTSLARGSEQYRALVADEPGIRTIADHLQGEFILVWKGHAYRIR